jgi:hypothetical protein
LRVERRSRLVQHDNIRIVKKNAGKCQALLFAPDKV